MVNVNPFNLIGVNLTAPPAPGFNRGTRVTAQNGHYLDFSADVTWGLFADGQPWFIADGANITGRFPVARNFGGNMIDGYTLNPQLNGTQGYDERRDEYAAPPAFPITPRKMDVLVSVECMETSNAGAPNAFRDGYFKNQGQAWFTCLTKPPAPGTFSPTVHWPADDVNRLLRPMRVPDIDGMLARLPSYSASGITSPPAWASFATTIDQPSAAWLDQCYGLNQAGSVGDGGYEGGFPRGFSGGAGNYGLDIADEFNRAGMAAVLNHWSTADKRAFLVRMCQHGNQWIEPFRDLSVRQFVADGGHWQWHWPAASIWLDATGQNARAQNLFTAFPGNYDQVFAATASMIANDFVRHTSATKPFTWRERTISGVSGLTMTVDQYPDENANWRNLVMTRVDGQSARITTFNGSTYVVTAENQVTPPWANGDVVYFVPGHTITNGMLQWCARGTAILRDFNPGPDSNYISLQSWSGHVLLLRALGIVPPVFENVADFVALCNAGNYPAPAPYAYPTHLETEGKPALSTFFTQVWNAHWATANAVPQRPGF